MLHRGHPMRYQIEISNKAREQLQALLKEQRRNIGWRMEEMREDLRGDVIKLQAKDNYYRLRVGNWAHLTFWQIRQLTSPRPA